MAKFSCGYKIVKYLLFVFNFFFWASGAVLLAIGIWFMADGNALRTLHISSSSSTGDSLVKAAAIVIIVVGALMFIIGGLGCCGACREVPECLLAFASVLMILLLGQLVTGILAGVFYDRIVRNIEQEMNETLQMKYGLSNATAETDAWNVLQTEMSCCGLHGPSDWIGSYWYLANSLPWKPTWTLVLLVVIVSPYSIGYINWVISVSETISSFGPVPPTCCRLVTKDYQTPQPTNTSLCSAAASQLTSPMAPSMPQTSNQTSTPDLSLYLNIQGCEATFKAWIKSHLAIIIGVAIGLIGIQVGQGYVVRNDRTNKHHPDNFLWLYMGVIDYWNRIGMLPWTADPKRWNDLVTSDRLDHPSETQNANVI